MLSAVLGLLDSSGKRIDAALKTAGGFLPVWFKLGTGMAATAVVNGKAETEVTLAIDVDAVAAAVAALGTSGIVETVPSTGSATVTLASLALPSSSVTWIDSAITAVSGTWGFAEDDLLNANTLSGFSSGFSPKPTSNFPIWPSVSIAWSGGTLTVSGTGPKATITNCADNGSGGTTVTVSGPIGGPLSSTLTGQSVTISGVLGTTEANGVHVATRLNSTSFDIPVAFVNAYASGGQVVLTTPPSITWAPDVRLRARVP